MDGLQVEANEEVTPVSASLARGDEIERKARVDAIWQQMNKGVSLKTLNSTLKGQSSSTSKTSPKSSSQNWMTVLGLAPKRTSSSAGAVNKFASAIENGTRDDAKKLAAVALLAVKDAAAVVSALARGKIEVKAL